jgi:ferric-dicitrate binding protein FerR (iron transport regulator)
MRSKKHTQELIRKFILNECDKKEIELLISYIQEIKQSGELLTVEDLLALLDEKPHLSEIDANHIYDKIINFSQEEEIKPLISYSNFWRYAVAASLVLCFSIAFLFNKNRNEVVQDTLAIKTIETGTDKAILTLSDGSQLALGKGESVQINNATSNGEKIIYEAAGEKFDKITHNFISVPRGGQFQITLSDGTKVWLNSESQLKFPVSFHEGKSRVVELIYGEAYFDVSHGTNHKGSKFIVQNKSQEIEVFGTEFNIKAYKGETNIYTTLVNGKVSVSSSGNNLTLKPGEQSNLNLKNSLISISPVNIHNEISWKSGVFSFQRKTLEEIMTVLSRWYDFDVEFARPEIKTVGFNGVLGKDQDIESILESIKGFGIISDYQIKNKTIILK